MARTSKKTVRLRSTIRDLQLGFCNVINRTRRETAMTHS